MRRDAAGASIRSETMEFHPAAFALTVPQRENSNHAQHDHPFQSFLVRA